MSVRVYYGWVLTVGLGITAAVSWGVLYYAFPVFIMPMGEELGWSRTAITGALSVATIVAGVAAVPVGLWIDRHGSRAVMTAGSVAATVALLFWSRVTSLPGFYGLAILLGLCQAMLFYEPAFAVVANWFARYRARALTVLTFLGGFASVIFVPGTTLLVEAAGWRAALMWLAVIVATVTVPLHALLVRRHPEDLGLHPDGAAGGTQPTAVVHRPGPPPGVAFRQAVRSRGFVWLAVAFGLSAFATTGLSVHMIPLLLERGHSPRFAGMALGALGLVALPGRLILTPLGDVWSSATVAAMIFGLQAIGIGILIGAGSTGDVWLFVALFGIGFGAITPARAALLAELYGRVNYASIAGRLALILALARASAPVGLSLVHAAGGGYVCVLWLTAAASAAAGGAVALAGSHVGTGSLT